MLFDHARKNKKNGVVQEGNTKRGVRKGGGKGEGGSTC